MKEGHNWKTCICERCGKEHHNHDIIYQFEPSTCVECGGLGYWFNNTYQDISCGCGSEAGFTRILEKKACRNCGHTVSF